MNNGCTRQPLWILTDQIRLERVTHADVEGFVARTSFGVVTNGVASAVLVLDLSESNIGAGALRQSVRVANCPLVCIVVNQFFVVLAGVRSHQGAVRTDRSGSADQSNAAVFRSGRSDGVAERVAGVSQSRAVGALVFAVSSESFNYNEVVVGSDQRVAADIGADRWGSANCRQVVVTCIVSNANVQRTIRVASPCTDLTLRRCVASLLAYRVGHFALEAFDRRRLVHDSVAVAGVVASHAEQVLGGTSVAQSERVSYVTQGFVVRGVLTAQGQLAGGGRFQTNVRLTVSDRTSNIGLTGVNFNARFQHEDSAQTTAQIFRTFETQTGGRAYAAGDFGGVSNAAALADDTGIDDTVDRYVRLCKCCRAHCAQDGHGDKGFFHYVFPSVVLL